MEFLSIEDLLKDCAKKKSKPKGRGERLNAWDKFYTLYAFDEIKYHKLCEQFPNENRYKLRQQCYVLDDEGKRRPLGDEKYILSYKKLRQIMQKLANYVYYNDIFNQQDCISVDFSSFTLFIEKYKAGEYKWRLKEFNGQNFETREVEIKGTWQMPLKERYLRHWYALRLIECGENIEDACEKARKADLTRGYNDRKYKLR